MVKVDCLVALNHINLPVGEVNPNTDITNRVRRFLLQDWRVAVDHVYREGNRRADFLATYGLSLNVGFHLLGEPPDALLGLIREDADGIGISRVVSSVY
ncbi:hypothetical protein K1719_027026 [Acacia pycnantha]|nr:hypothetical protein K1719_027026 [Acacia pycnantha]